MTPLDPFALAATWPWQVALHSALGALVCYAWTRRERLPPGRLRRRLLAVLLVLPLLTTLGAGARDAAFRGDGAWFDSGRVLALRLAGVPVAVLVAALGVLTVVATLGQEVLPALRRHPRSAAPVPADLLAAARALPGWTAVDVRLVAGRELLAAAGGWPGRPRLLLSEELLATLEPPSLLAVVRHEHAHAAAGRWWAIHALFLARLAQAFSPAALWLFREYAVEIEIACDRAAVGDGDPRPLARALLAFYERLHPRDLAARATLRRRVDLLLAPAAAAEEPRLGAFEVAAAALLLALCLPWVV